MDMEIIEPGEDESGNKLVQATARLPGKNKTFVHWRFEFIEESNYYCLQRPAFVDNIMPGTDTSLVFGAVVRQQARGSRVFLYMQQEIALWLQPFVLRQLGASVEVFTKELIRARGKDKPDKRQKSATLPDIRVIDAEEVLDEPITEEELMTVTRLEQEVCDSEESSKWWDLLIDEDGVALFRSLPLCDVIEGRYVLAATFTVSHA